MAVGGGRVHGRFALPAWQRLKRSQSSSAAGGVVVRKPRHRFDEFADANCHLWGDDELRVRTESVDWRDAVHNKFCSAMRRS